MITAAEAELLTRLAGDHRYDAVRRDFDCWQPHLDGPVVLHDSTGQALGPGQLVDELVDSGWRVVERVDAATVLRAPVGEFSAG